MKQLLPVLLFIIISPLLYAQPGGKAPPPRIHLTDSVFCTAVKDQSQSPTCWVFGTNSLFESDLVKKYNLRLDLSEMFIARYAYIDKAKEFLATKGKTYCEGGGQFHDVIRVVNKYGMVPEEAYSGKTNGEYNHNHAGLDTAMKRFIQQLLQQGKTELNVNDLRQINDTLDGYLGKVPETFWYAQKQYSPKTFAREVVRSGDDYVELMSFADLPLYKKCLLADKFNWAGDSLYNITLDDMQVLVDTALAKGWSVGWEGDVTNSGFNFYKGYATVSDPSHRYEEERLLNYKNESIERDHMLHLAGIGRDEHNRKWYYMKNSWGTWFSKFKGYLFMEENYFKLNTVILMVNKKGLPQSLKNRLRIK